MPTGLFGAGGTTGFGGPGSVFGSGNAGFGATNTGFGATGTNTGIFNAPSSTFNNGNPSFGGQPGGFGSNFGGGFPTFGGNTGLGTNFGTKPIGTATTSFGAPLGGTTGFGQAQQIQVNIISLVLIIPTVLLVRFGQL